jgi:acyl-CoA synthetase (NDP forming)
LTNPLENLLQPRSIAIVGASSHSRPDFVVALQNLGFKGALYLVNIKEPEVHGIKTYMNVNDIPGPVDYVITAIPAAAVPGLIDDCARKGVKVAHLYTGRFGETGRAQDASLEQEVLRRARKGGVRIIGPNCMGLYYPRLGIGWSDDFPTDSGPVGMASQSSYAPHDLIMAATPRGIRFSKVIGFGNALDLNECDFLEYLTDDPDTKVILFYIEGVKDGTRFLRALRRAAESKPTIIIKGGKGEAGARAAASHTASLAGSIKTWKAMVAQAGAIFTSSLEEMMDYALTFSFVQSISGPNVGIAGSGGGPSVLAADQCEEAGLKVVPLPDTIRDELKRKDISIWDWVSNPVDMSITGGLFSAGDLLNMMARDPHFDFLIAIMGEQHYQKQMTGMMADNFLKRYGLSGFEGKPLLAVVPDKSYDMLRCDEPSVRLMADIRTRLIESHIPIYPTMERAARSARMLLDYSNRKKKG